MRTLEPATHVPTSLRNAGAGTATSELQEMNGRALVLPMRRQDRPDRDSLAERWADFGQAM